MVIESKHDAHQLGPLVAGGNPTVPLASLADLVRHVMSAGGQDSVPLRAAATRVLDALQSLDPAPVLYLTERGDYALPIAPECCPAIDARAELAAPADFLAALRRVWATDACSPDVLCQAPWARLAMRNDLAAELFDCGPERSFWESPAPSVAAAQSTHWPPPGLEWLPGRDLAMQRGAQTDEVRPRPLVLLAELVHMMGARDRLPVKRAAAAVLDALTKAGPLPVFVLVRGDLARPVTDADVWRPRLASGAEQLAAWQALDDVVSWPLLGMGDEERRARGMELAPNEFNGLTRAELLKLPALPELRGAAGLAEWLRWCWVGRADGFDHRDDGLHAGVSILADDAVRLYGQFSLVDEQSAATGTLDTSAGFQTGAGLPSDADLLSEHGKLVNTGKKKTTASLAQKYKVSADTIQRALKRARSNASGCASPSAVSSVFDLGKSRRVSSSTKPAARARS